MVSHKASFRLSAPSHLDLGKFSIARHLPSEWGCSKPKPKPKMHTCEPNRDERRPYRGPGSVVWVGRPGRRPDAGWVSLPTSPCMPFVSSDRLAHALIGHELYCTLAYLSGAFVLS